MAELMKFMQASNGAFKSEQMKSFCSKLRGEISSGGSLAYSSPPPSFSVPNPTQLTGASVNTTSNATNTSSVQDNANRNLNNASTNSQSVDNQSQLQRLNDEVNANNDNGNGNSNQTSSSSNTSNFSSTPANSNRTKASSPSSSPSGASCPKAEAATNMNLSAINAALAEVAADMDSTRQLLVEQVIEGVSSAHMDTCLNTHQAVKDATQRFYARKEAGQIPDMSKMSASAGNMWDKMLAQMQPEMAKATKFCMMLPGFNELCQDDQMRLIKQGTFEVMMTRFAMLINHEKDTMLDPSHMMIIPRQAVKMMPMGHFLEGFFNVGAQFNPVGLNDAEIGLFTAILVLNPSRQGAKDISLITALHSLYQQAFYLLLKRNHSDFEEKFRKALGLTPMFRRISEEHTKALSAMKSQNPGQMQQFPPVHKEFFDKDSQQ